MDRKQFLKLGVLGTGILATSKTAGGLIKNDIDELKPLNIIGFNHLPSTEMEIQSNVVYHPSQSRGLANHGWLTSRHSFSFANYYNPERMHFGALRVLNDDIVAPGRGFGTHPHDNMEIISIPLSGDLEHKDSMGNTTVIKEGDIQVMSAGTGITHSEYNKNADKDVRFLQIWMFPNKRGVKPRYDQITLDKAELHNRFYQILSPNTNDAGVWVHQDAWFHLGDFEAGQNAIYQLKNATKNGVYIFMIDGEASANGQTLSLRDGLGLWSLDQIDFEVKAKSRILLMEVPMEIGG